MKTTYPNISAYIITKNEEANIARAIKSVKWMDEIVVLDSGSTDATCSIALELGACVEHREFTGFTDQKNAAMNLCHGEWLFNIDADEEMTIELRHSIEAILMKNNNTTDIYKVCRKNNYLGQWIKHCGWYPEYRSRLSKAGKACWYGGSIHEELRSQSPYQPGYLKGDLLHWPFNSLYEHVNKIMNYADIWAQDRIETGKNPKIHDIFLRPIARFIKMYFLKLGFLDGRAGLLASQMGAFYVFMKYARFIELSRRNK